MSYYGYTTETFAIVYTLFDAFFGRRADSSQFFWTPSRSQKKMSNSKCDFQQLFFRGSESKKFGLTRVGFLLTASKNAYTIAKVSVVYPHFDIFDFFENPFFQKKKFSWKYFFSTKKSQKGNIYFLVQNTQFFW